MARTEAKVGEDLTIIRPGTNEEITGKLVAKSSDTRGIQRVGVEVDDIIFNVSENLIVEDKTQAGGESQ